MAFLESILSEQIIGLEQKLEKLESLLNLTLPVDVTFNSGTIKAGATLRTLAFRIRAFNDAKEFFNSMGDKGLHLCACLGRQFNEPECPCTMQRLNLPPSPERLAHEEWLKTPEAQEQNRLAMEALRAAFDRRSSE